MSVQIIVNKDKCNGCEKCYYACPKGPRIWKKDKDGKFYVYDVSDCHNCKICVGKCPVDAITINILKDE